ncbi:immunoglobulin-like domain-containing protein, partial [Roseicyclus marinus]
DVYVDGSEVVLSVSGASVAGETFENLVIDATQATVVVSDTIDSVAVTLEAQSVLEGQQITILARVEQPPQTDLVLTLSNGQTLTIAAGSTGGSVTFANPNTEDAIIDTGTLSYSVTGVAGGNFEAVDISGASVNVLVRDTDTTTKVFLDDVVVTEGDTFQYSVSVDNAPATDLVLTLSNGVTITIPAGQTSATSDTQTAPATNVEFATTISIQSATGGNYERLDIGDTGTLRVLDIDHPATITGLGASGGDLILDEGDFPIGTNEVKDTLTQEGSFTITAEDGVGNLTINGVTVISNGAFTPTEITTGLGNTLSITAYSAETGQVSYSYTLLDAENHLAGQSLLDTLTETFAVTLSDQDGDHANATLTVRVLDDAPVATLTQNLVMSGSTQGQVISANMGVKVGADLDGASVVIAGAGSPVTNADGQVLTSAGQAMVYVSDGNGGLRAVINQGSNSEETIFTVTPTIGSDGVVSYGVEVMGVIDPATSLGFDLSTAREIKSGREDIVVVENNDGTRLVITAFENDGARTIDSTSGWEQTDANISQQGIGVDSQFVTNKKGGKDKVGEKLVLEFENDDGPMNIGAIGIMIDHLFSDEQLLWVAYSDGVKVAEGQFPGAGNGSNSGSDQLLLIQYAGGFDRVDLLAADDTNFRIIPNEIAYVFNPTPHQLNLSATVKDGDQDAISTDFSVSFDNLLPSDMLTQGGDGDDLIYAGAAGDVISGGDGADVFLFNALSDLVAETPGVDKTISDFNSIDGDRLDLDSILGQIDSITNKIVIGGDAEGALSQSQLTITAGNVDYDMMIRNLNDTTDENGVSVHNTLDIETLLGASASQSDWTDIISINGELNGTSDNAWTFQIVDSRPNLTYEPDPVTGNLVFKDGQGERVSDVHVQVSQNGVTHDVENADEISWTP